MWNTSFEGGDRIVKDPSPDELRLELPAEHNRQGMWASPAMCDLEVRLQRLAASDLTLLLVGEPGVGKTWLARWIHMQSPRRRAPFLMLDCTGLADEALRRVVFGSRELGLSGGLERASGGTLCLRAIDQLSERAQRWVANALEHGSFAPIVAVDPRRIDVRLVATACTRLAESPGIANLQLARGPFASGLVTVPPLRARPEDVAGIAARILSDLTAPGARVPSLSEEVLAILGRCGWPDNVRGLKAALAWAHALCAQGVIEVDHLPEVLQQVAGKQAPVGERVLTRRRLVREHELDLVQEALTRSNGNQWRAASIVGMPLRTFQRRVAELAARKRG